MNGVATDTGGGRSLKFHQFLLEFARGYLERFALAVPLRLRQVLERILRCRTAALGGQLFRCSECGDRHYQYHSCNDRHCPQCGQADADDWLARQRQRLLLPVSYFLVTFTVPGALRPWIRSHLQSGLDVLFSASAQAPPGFGR
jgi:Transposase zinc-binding domain